MALIECSECGQMVSENAKWCPKCGCPVDNQPNDFKVNNKRSGSGRKWTIAVLSIIVLIAAVAIAFYVFSSENSNNDLEMIAPQITADADGFIVLDQCPTQYPSIRIALEGEGSILKAKVYKNYMLLQILEGEEEYDALATDIIDINDPKNVHFMDINFDGYVDIFIGPSMSRTKSSVFLWNPTSGSFQQVAKDEMLQNIILEPSSKSFYQGGSGSWCFEGFSRYKWTYYSIEELETLEIVSDASQYEDYNVTHEYTVKTKEGKIVSETDNISELPEKWRAVYERYKEIYMETTD